MSETRVLHRVRIFAGLFPGLFLLLSFRGEGDPLGQTDPPGEFPSPGVPGESAATGSGTPWEGGPLSQQGPAPAATAAALPLLNSFAGVMDISLDGLRVIPPDTDGAVGPSHVVTLVNRGYLVHDKTTGAPLAGLISLQAFWAALGTAAGQPAADPFDPHLLYDQYSGRFVAISDSGSDGAPSWLLVGISKGSDPMLGWTLFAIDVDATSPNQFADFPGLGLDPMSVYITNNMFNNSGTFEGVKFWVVDKASLLAGGPITVSEFIRPQVNFGLRASWQPAHAFGPTTVNYIINEGWFGQQPNPTAQWLRIQRFSYPGPVLADLGFIRVADFEFDTLGDAPQGGCSQTIDTGDKRLSNVVLRNGHLWTTHHVDDPVKDGVGKTEVAWYEIDPSLANANGTNPAVQQGRVSDPVRWYYYPSIAVNDSGSVALGFSGSDAATFAGGFYTGRRAIDPSGTMAPVGLLKGGLESYYQIFSGTVNRWGDYSTTSLDPSDGRTFWTIQEFAGQQVGGTCPTKDTGRWGTWWGTFRTGCSTNADCDDGILCNGAETCDVASGSCLAGTPPTCDDGNACTADSCDFASNACVHSPIPGPGPVGDTLRGAQGSATSATTLTWSTISAASLYNTYRGTVPASLMAGRTPVYDHVCFESGDEAGNGATLSTDASVPSTGRAFYYLVDGENACGEGPLGTAPDGTPTPNTSPCPTPP